MITTPVGIKDWPLAILARADVTVRRGILADVARSSVRRRHIIYFSLALSDPAPDKPEQFDELLAAGERDVVCQVLHQDRAPEGLISALGRLGPNPISTDGYRRLADLYTQSEHARRRWALAAVSPITDQVIRSALAISDRWIVPELLTEFSNVEDAAAFGMCLDALLLRCSTATAGSIRSSIRAALPDGSVAEWLRRWLARVDPWAPCLSADPRLSELLSGTAILQTARRYRNCLASHRLPDVVLGKIVVVEWVESPALAVLVRMSSGELVFEEIVGESNRAVPEAIGRPFLVALRSHGVLLPVNEFTSPDIMPFVRTMRMPDRLRGFAEI